MLKKRNKVFTLIAIALSVASCGGGDGGMDRKTRIKLDQYLAKGESLYTLHCLNCHQDQGEGLAQLYPPLAKSDYLLADLPRAACIIKNGQFKEIKVNGQSFNQMMPALSHLTNLEIAEILTYVTNSWGNAGGLQSVKEVDVWLANCEEE